MSALDDAKRFIWLDGFSVSDNAMDLLKDVVTEIDKFGRAMGANATRVRLESKIAELEAQNKQLRDRARTIEHDNVRLQEEMKSDRMMRRIRELEAEVKRANERTRTVEHQLVIAAEQESANRSR